jgi:hypothetical protein
MNYVLESTVNYVVESSKELRQNIQSSGITTAPPTTEEKLSEH